MQCDRCTFYSVVDHYYGEDNFKTEAEKFFERYELVSELDEAVEALLYFITEVIGNNHGPIDGLLNRDEHSGLIGLPNKGVVKIGGTTLYYPSFPLRIYALKVSNKIVILFNGGIKDNSKNQNSSLHFEWQNALKYSARINQAIYDKEILIDDCSLFSSDGTTTIII